MEEGEKMAVLAETIVQVLVSDDVILPLAAEKIDEIVASIRNLECFVIENKVVFQGILHKQIFFVSTDSIVHHYGIDIPFSGFGDVPGVPAGMTCQLIPEIVFLDFKLVSPELLRENVVIDMGIIVLDMPSNVIEFTNTLPMRPLRFGKPGTVRVQGPNGGIPI